MLNVVSPFVHSSELAPADREILAQLRMRDDDADYADSPVLDVYARISQNPDDEMQKTDRQIREILRAMRSRSCRVGIICRDDNISAWLKNGKRPGWDATLERVRSGDVDGVFVVHIDRYLRQPMQAEQLIDASDNGAVVWSLYGDFQLDNGSGRFFFRTMVNQAAMQSDETARRVRSKLAARRAEGLRHGGPRAMGMPGKGVDDATVTLERRAIREGALSLIAGRKLGEIAREWAAMGISPVRGGHAITYMTVRTTLSRGYIAGLLEHKGQVVGTLSQDEPIITEDQYRQVAAILASNRPGRPKVSQSYPLARSGMRCGECGGAMTGKVSGRVRRYSCCRCHRVSINAERTETLVRDHVLRALTDPARPAIIAARVQRLADARARLRDAEGRLAAMAERVGRGEMSIGEWDAMRPPLAQAVEDARANVDALELAGGALAEAETGADFMEQWEGGRAADLTRSAFAQVTIRKARSSREAVEPRVSFTPRDESQSRDESQ